MPGREKRLKALARQILRLRFGNQDHERMHVLAVKNQQGELSTDEHEELENYVRVGDLLAILHSKARRILLDDDTQSQSR